MYDPMGTVRNGVRAEITQFFCSCYPKPKKSQIVDLVEQVYEVSIISCVELMLSDEIKNNE